MTRRIVMFNRVSADGYFASKDGALDWVVPDEEMDRSAASSIAKGGVDTFLFGRRTYEMFAAFWPTALDGSDTSPDPHNPGKRSKEIRAMAELLNRSQKVVFSRTLRDATWQGTTIEAELEPEAIAAMKRGPGEDIMIFGSGTIVSALTRHRLIDEYQILVSPLFLGDGRPLIAEVASTAPLELRESKAYPTGNVFLRYGLRG